MVVLERAAKRWKFDEAEFLKRLKIKGSLVDVETCTTMSVGKENKFVVVEVEEE